MKVASTYKKIQEQLEPLGYTFATVNAGHEIRMTREANVNNLPCVVLVLDGKTYLYQNNLSLQPLVDFLRQKMPYKMIVPVDDSNVHSFLSGWEDNKVRALILEPRKMVRLRYLTTAFQFRARVVFG